MMVRRAKEEKRCHCTGFQGRWDETGRSESRSSLPTQAIIATQEDVTDAARAELREQIAKAHRSLCEILLVTGGRTC